VKRQKVAILGATGSIGTQTLEVIDSNPERFEVFGLVAGTRPFDRAARLTARAGEPDLERRIEEMVTHPDCDIVVVAIPGARALGPTLTALRAGKTVALASKEVLVIAGDLVMSEAHHRLRPIDSEHSAIWQCLWGEAPESVRRLLLTASGGPFWQRPDRDLEKVTIAEALAHPRWNMGPKVTIDSATLMNKGLEMIEAHHLFATPLEQIAIVVHPQSIVHSLVEFKDGSIKAQLGVTDMRLPIAVALAYPERLEGSVPTANLAEIGRLDFAEPDFERFPMPELARAAAAAGGGRPAVLNAANEEAVAAFLRGEISFAAITRSVAAALDAFPGCGPGLEEILDADRWARGYFLRFAGKV
jgi:1-deoxy-D-xylulose-5-phosphate reductoisomerase